MEGEPDPLPPDVAALAELLGERIGLGKGIAGGLELRFGQDGSLRKWQRLEEGGRSELAHYNQQEGTADGERPVHEPAADA